MLLRTVVGLCDADADGMKMSRWARHGLSVSVKRAAFGSNCSAISIYSKKAVFPKKYSPARIRHLKSLSRGM